MTSELSAAARGEHPAAARYDRLDQHGVPARAAQALPALLPVAVGDLVDAITDRVIEVLEAQPPRPALLTRSQLARELGCCSKTVARLEGDGLPRVMLGDSPRYELAAVLAWLRQRGQ